MNRVLFCIGLFIFHPTFAELSLSENSGQLLVSGDCIALTEELAALASYREFWDGSSTNAVISSKDNNTCAADIANMVPPEMTQINGKHWLQGAGGFGNCHGTALYFSRISPLLAHHERMDPRFLKCERIPYKNVKAGDIGMIFSDEETIIHSFTLLTKDITFTKNGHNGENIPYQFMGLTDLANIYYQFHTADDLASPVINYYQEDLKMGLDCLRGDSDAIDTCNAEFGHPFTVYYRCQSLQEMEKPNQADLAQTGYDSLKAEVLKISIELASDPNAISSASSETITSLKDLEDRMNVMQSTIPVETDLEKVWLTLSGFLDDILQMADPDAEIHQVLFNKKDLVTSLKETRFLRKKAQ